jgi:hypothetical protein
MSPVLSEGSAQGNTSVNNFLWDTFANLLALHVVEGQEVAQQTSCCIATKERISISEQRASAIASRSHGRAYASHATTGNDYVEFILT